MARTFSLAADIEPTVSDRAAEREAQTLAETFEKELGDLGIGTDEAGLGGIGGARAQQDGGGGGLGGLLGAGAASGGLLKVALGGAVGFGLLKGIEKLAGASPALKQTNQMFSEAMDLFFRPFGNFLSDILRPTAEALLDMAVNFNEFTADPSLENFLGLSFSEADLIGSVLPTISTEDLIRQIPALGAEEILAELIGSDIDAAAFITKIGIPALKRTDIMGALDIPDIDIDDIIPNPLAPDPDDVVSEIDLNRADLVDRYQPDSLDEFFNLVDVSLNFTSVLRDTVQNPDWSTIINSPEWNGIVDKVSWGEYLDGMDWGQYVDRLQWGGDGGFIESFSWGAYVDTLGWDSFVGSFNWGQFVPDFDWDNFISGVDLSDYLPGFDEDTPLEEGGQDFIGPGPSDPPDDDGGSGGSGDDDDDSSSPADPVPDWFEDLPGVPELDPGDVPSGGDDDDGTGAPPSNGGAIPTMARGGVARRRQTATIGEAGPEAVMPLDNLSREIQRAIREGMRASGGGSRGDDIREAIEQLIDEVRGLRQEMSQQDITVTVDDDSRLDPF